MVQTAAGVARNDWVLFMRDCRSQYNAWKALQVVSSEPPTKHPPRKRPKKPAKEVEQLLPPALTDPP